ncbi:hypothetical protein CEXT_389961 [Caerostris extrusa]|uniref:Uncharacterized protein n=1 Tax=Caerostris extrusa TaxID=172846 RepID=A0AAV4Q0Y5_CAEEX|nr:hypothetical protein CEXT_389961 [Caerostris extrusa]
MKLFTKNVNRIQEQLREFMMSVFRRIDVHRIARQLSRTPTVLFVTQIEETGKIGHSSDTGTSAETGPDLDEKRP